ncbi:HAD family hydrolase [Inquilinus limosus]|uniref:HAD family hydrolase n=1 Tax=Inquilinus limosus TaxID=171674 RepID=UPI001C5326F9|nr:HAD family hydrolase [Inquilinus limosus]
MAGIRGILFDKDGTLIDYDATWRPLNREAALFAAAGDPELALRLLEAGGADPHTGVVRADSLFAAGATPEIAAAFIAAGSPYGLDLLVPEIDRIFRTATTAPIRPTVADPAGLFRRLRGRGLTLGVASSDGEVAIRATLAMFGLLDLVDFIAGYDSGHGHKPNPGMVYGFCDATGLPPGAVLMVGDNRHDMAMGRAAGCGLCVGVLSGTGSVETLAGLADLCLPDIGGLEDLLDEAQRA